MKVDGFELFLEDYCSYCPNFEPEIDKIDVTRLGEAARYINNIKCVHEEMCERIAENLENKINGKSKA